MDLATVDHLLTSTRSVRKRLDFDRPIAPEVIEKCIEIALQAPTGSNMQGWSVVVVTDADKKRAIADHYRTAMGFYAKMIEEGGPRYEESDLRAKQLPRVYESAFYLAEHFEKAPVMVIFCIDGRVEEAGLAAQASIYGSILPAAWSFMLAARARGLGSAWTTLHLFHEKETSELLGIPPTVTQSVLLPVAYFTGDDFKPAKRLPAKQLTHWNRWGNHRG
ncbi:MAG: nitroreductase family protein [Deltaproteobacteria bacterium]|nr:nitroreductase family protein [Deltaproteobacteria bacterium]